MPETLYMRGGMPAEGCWHPAGKRPERSVDGRVLRGGAFVNRVRSGRKQP